MTQLSILSHKQKLGLRKFAKQNSIKLDIRALSGILYLLRTGCQRRMIPPRYGKWKTLYQKFRSWSASHWFSDLQKRLISRIRQKSCRKGGISTIIIDSQSVKSGLTQSVKGVDGAKRIKGIKRHIAVDSNGLPLEIIVTKANVHDPKAACRFITLRNFSLNTSKGAAQGLRPGHSLASPPPCLEIVLSPSIGYGSAIFKQA